MAETLSGIVSNHAEDSALQHRNRAGPAKGKPCGVAMSFPFVLLDIYVGAWAAACLPGMLEERLLPEVPAGLSLPGFEDELSRGRSFAAPDMCQHLKAVLCLDEFLLDGADPRSYIQISRISSQRSSQNYWCEDSTQIAFLLSWPKFRQPSCSSCRFEMVLRMQGSDRQQIFQVILADNGRQSSNPCWSGFKKA